MREKLNTTAKESEEGVRSTPDIARLLREAAEIPQNDPRRGAASLAMFDQLSEHWSLRGDERETLLGGVSKSTWSEWKQKPLSARIRPDTRERIANMFTIDLNAHSLFAPEFADVWVRQPHAAFDGKSPLSVMLRGKVEDLVFVRRHLERVRTSSSPARDVKTAIAQKNEPAPLPALEQAVVEAERLVEAQPGHFEGVLASALESLAEYHARTGEMKAAVGELQRACELDSRFADVHAVRGITGLFSHVQDLNRAFSCAMEKIEAEQPQTTEEFADILTSTCRAFSTEPIGDEIGEKRSSWISPAAQSERV
jgi:uncharacterized protein (DUF2384 family)